MRGILRRTVNGGPTGSVRRGFRRLVRKRARVLVVLVVASLLVSSLPASSSTMQKVNMSATAPAQQTVSLPVQLYRAVSQTVASIGSWMAAFVATEPASNSPVYQPVVAYISPAPPFIDPPLSLTVTAAASNNISLSWTAPAGTVDHYILERSENIDGPFLPIFPSITGATTKNDNTVTNLHAYLYRVRAVSSGGAISAPSNIALGTAISFQFSSLQGQEIRAQHFYDVRTAINLVRALGNVPDESWDRGTLANLEVKADDVNEMRSALNEGLQALNIPLTAYEDPILNVGMNGTLIRGIHIEQLQTRSTRGSSNSSGPIDSDSSTARIDPLNETGGGGENPLSRNFNWSLPLVSLPGRAGLDLNLTLAYNSLVWTKVGTNLISFDADNGFPGPGFRLGFPVIQQSYFNPQVGKQAYLLIRPDGGHTELRQVGQTPTTSVLWEAADSSYLLFNSSTKILQTTDGTQMTYEEHGAELKCTKIKDRNGNYISVSYNAAGDISTVTDTLNRVINFVYENGWLKEITQTWNQHLTPSTTHYWAKFQYKEDTPINFDFGNMTVIGATDNSNMKMLEKVTLADNSHLDFTYTTWGQVYKITSYAPDNTPLNYRFYDLPQTGSPAHDDCPRFLVRKDWARYWNGDPDGTMNTSEEVATATFIIPVSDSWVQPYETEPVDGMRTQVTAADGTVSKIYFIGTIGDENTGWRRGLPALVNTFSGDPNPVRQVSTTWTQDDDTLLFPLNPRVAEINIRDLANNRARTQIVYEMHVLPNSMNCHLPRDVFEYEANGEWPLRTTRTTYNMSDTYKNLRILGLVSEKQVSEGYFNGVVSKVGFFYDDDNGSTSIVTGDTPVRHENPAYVNGRGNLSSVRRYDVNDAFNVSLATTISRIKYNIAGSVVSSKDASGHETTISYADSFSDGVTTHNAFAYPTSITDPDTFISTSKYNYDFGAVTSQRTPKPNFDVNKPESERPEQIFSYDNLGRLEQITNSVNAASTRFEYPTTGNRVDTYTKVKVEPNTPEAHSWTITDGFGRIVAAAKDHNLTANPNTFSGQKFVYDIMGRVFRTFNPTETTASGHPSAWDAVGDDETVGWLYYIEQTYDWNGRPLVTTNQDGTTKTASYSGCGCAGGGVVTLTDEGTLDPNDNVTPRKRQKKIYSDVLGREIKTEILNWEGGAVSTSFINTYNARDQLKMVRQFAADTAPADPADESCPITCQKTEMTYDGHGRLKTRHAPEQQVDTDNPASTDHITWDYNADDTIQKITDPRGGVSTFSYNGRHRTTNIAYTLLPNVPTTGPKAVAAAAEVSYQYDAAGNRKQMNDGLGHVTYTYDQLSRLMSETRFFSSLTSSSTGGNYTLSYEYNLANQLTKITDPTNLQVHYGYDHMGRLSGVTGTGFLNVTTFLSNIHYRAWGAPKSVAHKDNRTTETTYDERLRVKTYKLLPVVPDDSVKLHNRYDYFPDGRLKKLNDLDDHHWSIIGSPDTARYFSRVYRYDHRGRLLQATGWNPNGHEFDFPFEQYYNYNTYNDHLTQRMGSYYYQPNFNELANYLNNRREGWTYGADGQETHSTGPGMFRDWIYNAAGQMVQVKETQTANNQFSTYTTSYDGDGEQARESIQETSATSYKVRSSVLGDVVTRLNSAGNKTGTTVHLDKNVTPARVNSGDQNNVPFPIYDDPLRQSIAGDTKVVYDPLGNPISWRPWPGGPPPNFYPRSSASFGSIGSSFGSAQERGCQLDGIPTDCSRVMRLVNNGYPGVLVFDSLVTATRMGLIEESFYRGSDRRLVYTPYFLHNSLSNTPSFQPQESISETFHRLLVNKEFLKKLGHCLRDLFKVIPYETGFKNNADGSGGSLTFKELKTNDVFTVRTDTTFSRQELGVMSGNPARPPLAMARWANPYVNYIAKEFADVQGNPDQRDYQLYLALQVHEIGNSIAMLTGDPLRRQYMANAPMAKDVKLRAADKDPGMALEECVFGAEATKQRQYGLLPQMQ